MPSFLYAMSQFEGSQTYAMTCTRCGARSENNSNFLEIEVNLEVGLLMDVIMCRSSPHDRTILRSKAALRRFLNLRHYQGITSNVFSYSFGLTLLNPSLDIGVVDASRWKTPLGSLSSKSFPPFSTFRYSVLSSIS